MAKKKQPQNIEWVVSGRVTYRGATCIVHAKDRAEAVRKANDGDSIDGIDTQAAEMVDWEFGTAEPSVDDSE